MEEQIKERITEEGKRKLEERLRYLEGERTEENKEKLKEARAQGDLSENAEYDAAKAEQSAIAEEVAKIKAQLANSEVVSESEIDHSRVSFGAKVVVLFKELKREATYTIKGTSEADSAEGIISDKSPLGMALLGKKKGESVKYEAAGGIFTVKILSFENAGSK